MTAFQLWEEQRDKTFADGARSEALFWCDCEVCYGVWLNILAGKYKPTASQQFLVWLDSAMERWNGVVDGWSDSK